MSGIESLNVPLEVLSLFLDQLDERDLQSAVAVSRLWKQATLKTTRIKQNRLLNQFAATLRENLDKELYSEQIKQLLEIERLQKFKDTKNLKELNSAIQDLKNQIIPLLVSLKEGHLKKLELRTNHLQKPKSFDLLFEIAKLHQNADQLKIKACPGPYEFSDMVTLLIKYEQYHKAIEMALLLNSYSQYYSLKEISKLLLAKGDVTFALKVSNLITSEQEKSASICTVADHYTDRGETAKALEIIPQVLDPRHKASGIARICRQLLKMDKMDEAIDLAKTIEDKEPNLNEQRYVLVEICELLNDNIEKKLKVANLIQPYWARVKIYHDLFKKLVKSEKSDEALKYARSILDEKEKGESLEVIALTLLDMGDFEKSEAVAKEISEPNLRNYTLRRIAVAMHECGETDRAQNLLESITDTFHKRQATEELSKLHKRQRISIDSER